MSLQELQSEIEKKAEDEASKILETARQEAQKIVAEGETRAASLREEHTKALERNLDAQERAELAIARMDQTGDILRVRSELTNRVYEEVERRLQKIAEKGGAEYQELLSNYVLEGITLMNGSKFIVETNSRDKEAFSKILGTITEKAGKIKNTKVTLETGTLQAKSLGGVVVSTEDRVQYFNSTLEARLSTAFRKLENSIQATLFGVGKGK